MAKRITISIPDELYERIKTAKDDYFRDINTSQICQKALMNTVTQIEAHRVYENAGREDGAKEMSSIPQKIAARIAHSLNGDDPEFKDLSIFEAVQLLEIRLQGHPGFSSCYPRHSELYTGETILHDWLKYESGMSIEDKRGEVSWRYIEGWYQGVKDEFLKIEGARNA